MKADYTIARKHLSKADPKLGRIIKQVGPCRLHAFAPLDPFEARRLLLVLWLIAASADPELLPVGEPTVEPASRVRAVRRESRAGPNRLPVRPPRSC